MPRDFSSGVLAAIDIVDERLRTLAKARLALRPTQQVILDSLVDELREFRVQLTILLQESERGQHD